MAATDWTQIATNLPLIISCYNKLRWGMTGSHLSEMPEWGGVSWGTTLRCAYVVLLTSDDVVAYLRQAGKLSAHINNVAAYHRLAGKLSAHINNVVVCLRQAKETLCSHQWCGRLPPAGRETLSIDYGTNASTNTHMTTLTRIATNLPLIICLQRVDVGYSQSLKTRIAIN